MLLRLGAFRLDPGRLELRRGGEPVAVEPRVLELLAHLVRHRDRLVPKEELLEEVWEGRFVTESVLTRAVSEARKALGEACWIESVYGRGYRFAGEVEVEGGDDAGPATAPAPPQPLTPLIGRERALATLLELLDDRRLVTLTGPGGSGKTRLAVEAAHRRATEREESLFVPLATVERPEEVPAAVGRALGVRELPDRSPAAGVAERLAGAERLLVLDNFEQVVEAAPFVGGLVRACPRLTVLVTSRFVLGLEGEQELPVPPLELSPPEQPVPLGRATGAPPADGAAIASAPAVALFLARARSARPDFAPAGEELAEVAGICRVLDGLPLAIELAAPLVRLFPPAVLRRRLAERLDLLVSRRRDRPRRHRTLEGALDWSIELVGEDERAFLFRLAVFSGGFTPEAAERVAGGAGGGGRGGGLDRLAGLVDKSLVARAAGPAGEPRFTLLETTRELARRRLRESGDEPAALAAHRAWYGRWAADAERGLAGGDQRLWLARLDAEHDNLAAAIERSAQRGRLADALAIATAIWRYWSVRGLYREGFERMRALVERPEAAALDPALRARGLSALGGLAHLLCDLTGARRWIEEALELQCMAGDRRTEAVALNHLGWIDAQLGDLDAAERHSRRALELHRRLRDGRGRAVALNNLAWIAQYRGDWERAEAAFGDAWPPAAARATSAAPPSLSPAGRMRWCGSAGSSRRARRRRRPPRPPPISATVRSRRSRSRPRD